MSELQTSTEMRRDLQRRLWIALVLNSAFMIVEVIGGLISGSMALLSDAGHMFTDAGALALAIFAGHLALKPKDSQRTYGYLRAEIIGALFNALILLLLCGGILMEAWRRIGTPQAVQGGIVIVIGTLGLAVNLLSAWYLHRGRTHNLNMQGAYLHMMADALGSVGAIAAGIIIVFTGWNMADPIISIVIVALILRGAWRLLQHSIEILMEGTPREINYDEIAQGLKAREHIHGIHDLHIWTISSGVLALSAHIEVTPECANTGHWGACLEATQQYLRESWGIEHTTLQTEPPGFNRKG